MMRANVSPSLERRQGGITNLDAAGMKMIGPAMAAEVMGWRRLPHVGVPVIKVKTEVSCCGQGVNFFRLDPGGP